MWRQTTGVLLFAILVLSTQESWARQWNLPQSRPAALLRHDFSSNTARTGRQFDLLSSVVGLTGGETKLPEDVVDNTPKQYGAGDISRGGSTLTAVKRGVDVVDVEPAPPQTFEIQGPFNSNTTETSSIRSNATEISVVTPEKKDRFHKRIAKKLKNRNATNLRRKVMHASFGIFFAALNHFIPKHTFVPGMAVLSSATLAMELLRYRKGFGWMNKALHFVLGNALRKHEMDGKFTGSFYFFSGVTLTAALFPTSSATMGIIQLAIADPSASYFGRATRHVYWSRIENGLGGLGRNKGFLGFLGGALCCVPLNYRILSLAKFGAEGVPGGRASLALASLALGVAGAFADLAVPTPALTMPKRICGVRVPPFHVDDNFVVPVVSGYACTKVFQALGCQRNLDLARFLIA